MKYSRMLYALLWAALYTVATNLPYYVMLFPEHSLVAVKAICLSFVYAAAVFYACALFRPVGNVLLPFVFITSGTVLYFSLTYGYAQSKDMFALVFGTNLHEAAGVLSPVVLGYVGVAILASIFAIKTMPRLRLNWQGIVALAVLGGICTLMKPLLPVEIKGKHPMPFGYSSHFAHAVKQQWRMKKMIAEKKPLPSAVYERKEGAEPLYVVLALGESLRADHLQMYGYSRATTPLAVDLPLLRFGTCYSAGSGTTEAVTRMLTRATVHRTAPALTENSIISLFRQAGFRTMWLTNQGAMAKGETWVASIAKESEIFEIHPSVYSIGSRIQDADILPMLDKALALPPKDSFIILHSFGSHINPEDRYADEFRKYMPVCSKFSIADCTDEELVNSYDNSIIATDTYWAGLLERLKDKRCLLIITADHGDRLYGKYRGHDPSLMHNPCLRWVPLMIYASPSLKADPEFAKKLAYAESYRDMPVSHDFIFHTLMGGSGLTGPAYDPSLDLFSGKAKPHDDPHVKILGLEQTLPM